MPEEDADKYKWLIDRSDRLRGAVASGAGILVSAIALMMTGLTVVLSYVVNQALPTMTTHVWPLRIFIAGLVLSWVLMAIALLWAVSAIAAAHGFVMSRTPGANPPNSIADITHDMDLESFPSSLRSHLETAASFQRDAQNRLKTSLFVLAFALAVPFFGFALGAPFGQ